MMMFNFADFADKCLGQPWRFAITGGDELVMQLSLYSSCILYHWLTAVYRDTTTVSSDRMLLCILAASGFTDNFQLCLQGHIFGGCICSIAVY